VPVGVPDEHSEQRIATLRRMREDVGLPWEGFTIRAQAQYSGGDPDRWRRHAQRWKDLGATHLAVATHRAGDTDVDGHLARVSEYFAAVEGIG
jgi:hypothetical protein